MRTCFHMAVVLTCAIFNSVGARAADQPNILLIFADDLGWKDVGYHGTDFYETPNIDRLATEGMVFSAGYAAAGNCAPSRACLISGQYTPRHGVYAVGSTKRGPVNQMRLEPIANDKQLAASNVTMAEALKEAGYVTGHFGKWHIGTQPGCTPEDQGFDVSIDKNGKGSGIREDPKSIYAITEAACDFMEENKERPFFAYVPHHAIHTGLQTRQDTFDRFAAKTPGKQHDNPLYAGCTYDLDDGVGILLAKLKELGLEQNTLVVLTSDNGATGASSQEPLRGNKGSLHEGGIREPCAAHLLRLSGRALEASANNEPDRIDVRHDPAAAPAHQRQRHQARQPDHDVQAGSISPETLASPQRPRPDHSSPRRKDLPRRTPPGRRRN